MLNGYRRGSYDLNEIFAHEMAHAIDHNGRFSKSPEWWGIHTSEIRGKLSRESIKGRRGPNADLSPEEGFAEIGRIVLSSGQGAAMIERKYPEAYAFWMGIYE